MDKFDKFLSQVYGNSQSLLYLFIALGAIALFFIILILIILFSAEDASRKKSLKKEKVKEIEDDTKLDKISIDENSTNKVDTSKSLSETQVFNSILMNKENDSNEHDEDKREDKETVSNNEDVFENRNDEVEKEENYSIKTVFDNDFYLEKDATPIEEVEKNEDDFLSTPQVDTELSKDTREESVDDLENKTIEMPKVRPIDLDDYLLRRGQEIEEQKLEVKEEAVEVEKESKIEEDAKEEKAPVKLSNDELKNRLAKLKAKKEEKEDEIPDSDLENLMKAVGLEETTVIPKLKDEEKQVLGH